MSKILVLYSSRTGFTRAIAGDIACACGADVEAIEVVNQRGPASGYVRSAIEAALHLETPILSARRVPSDYDIVVIGTPIWLWNVASPVRSYIKGHRRQFRRVAFFCTSGGSGHAKVFRDLESLCGRPAVATWAVTDVDVSGEFHRDGLSEFADALKGTGRSRVWAGQGSKVLEESTIGL
jgi:flavodoxin